MTIVDGEELVEVWSGLLGLQEKTLHEHNGREEKFHVGWDYNKSTKLKTQVESPGKGWNPVIDSNHMVIIGFLRLFFCGAEGFEPPTLPAHGRDALNLQSAALFYFYFSMISVLIPVGKQAF